MASNFEATLSINENYTICITGKRSTSTATTVAALRDTYAYNKVDAEDELLQPNILLNIRDFI